MWWKIILFLLMSGVIISAFLTPSPMDPGMLQSQYHDDNSVALYQSEVFRIFYFHVPQAWIASLAFIFSMFYSIRYLQTRDMDYDMKAVAANSIGLIFAILATVTGSIFAKAIWGEYWNWSEIREVSIFILLLIYGAYFALRSALPNEENKATLSAVMSILFAVSAVFLIFVLPRLMSDLSQHPSDSVVDEQGKITMGPTVRYIFFSSLAAFTILFLWINNLAVRVGKIVNKKSLEI